MTEGVAAGIVEVGGVVVVFLRHPQYLQLRRQKEPPRAAGAHLPIAAFPHPLSQFSQPVNREKQRTRQAKAGFLRRSRVTKIKKPNGLVDQLT